MPSHDHLIDILEANAELGIELFILETPNSRAFLLPPKDRAAICIVADDHFASHGPEGLHAPSLHHWGARAAKIYCFAGGPVREAYRAALETTLTHRRPSLIVECTVRTELQWQRWARLNFPDKLCFIVTVKPEAVPA